jgi:hypothetical protein
MPLKERGKSVTRLVDDSTVQKSVATLAQSTLV